MANEGEEFRLRTSAGLAPEVVQRLSRLSPLLATLSLLETWGTIALAIALAARFPEPPVIALAVLAVAARQHALAILAHQSAHYRMYRTRWINDLSGKLCAWPLGISMVTYRVIHRIHHNHLYEPIDPDLALMAGYPRGRLYLARKLAKDLLGITVFKNYLYFLGPRGTGGEGAKDDTSPVLRAAARRDRWLALVFNGALVGSLVVLGGSWRYLLLWVLPAFTVLQLLLRLRAVCEHGAPGDEKDPLRAARTTLASWPVRWFLFPHSMNYHIEHHLYPNVPHYRLAECHRELAKKGVLAGAEVVPTFAGTLSRVFAPAPTPLSNS